MESPSCSPGRMPDAKTDPKPTAASVVARVIRIGRAPVGRLRIVRRTVAKMAIFRALGTDASFGRMSTAVLLAEPEPDTRGFLERHLADDGFHVLAAEPAALVEANGSSPDVV